MRTFLINGKKYVAKAIDFNTVCDFEDMGLAFADMQKKSTSFIRAYFSLCSGLPSNLAGKELEAHMLNGGTFEEIADAMAKELEESDFFRNLTKNKTEETPKKKA